jgi:hypothetical protein
MCWLSTSRSQKGREGDNGDPTFLTSWIFLECFMNASGARSELISQRSANLPPALCLLQSPKSLSLTGRQGRPACTLRTNELLSAWRWHPSAFSDGSPSCDRRLCCCSLRRLQPRSPRRYQHFLHQSPSLLDRAHCESRYLII